MGLLLRMLMAAGIVALGGRVPQVMAEVPDTQMITSEEESEEGSEEGSFELPEELTAEDYKKFFPYMCRVNSVSSILERHDSYEITYSFGISRSDDLPDHFYMTDDSLYMDSPKTALYMKDRLIYSLDDSYEEGGADFVYILDMRKDYNATPGSTLQAVPDESEIEEFLEGDYAEFRSGHVSNGYLYLNSMLREEGSRDYIENDLELTYDGETVYQSLTLDAETYEILEMTHTLAKGGELTEVMEMSLSYDSEMPRACHNLIAAAERYSEEKMEVSVIVNPGREDGISKTIIIPKGHDVQFLVDGDYEIYADPECTIPYTERWDRMSDKTFYILTK